MASDFTQVLEEMQGLLDNNLKPNSELVRRFVQEVENIPLDNGDFLKSLQQFINDNQAVFDSWFDSVQNVDQEIADLTDLLNTVGGVTDLIENSDVLNEVATSDQDLTPTTATDGEQKVTLSGLEKKFNQAIQAAGGVPLGTWAAGVTYNAYNEYLVYNGVPYKPAASTTLPYTTQGADPTVAPDAGLVIPFAEVTRSDLEKRTLYVEGVSELEALSLTEGANVYLTQEGRVGEFVVKAGTPPTDPYKGVYIVMSNGNYAERQFSGSADLRWFGAVAGASDSTDIINSALTLVDSVLIPENESGFSMLNVNIPDGKAVRGLSRKSVVSPYNNGNSNVFNLGNYSTLDSVYIRSDSGKDSGLTLQNGVNVEGKSRTFVTNYWAKGLGGAAYITDSIVGNHEGNTINNYSIESCNIGINAYERGEYLQGGGGNITLCNTGLRIQAGNINAAGMVISDNDIGVHLVQGSNDAHGQLIGALLNHNGSPGDTTKRTILVDAPDNGFLFSGCQLFNGSPIELKGCHNVWFRNCVKQAIDIIEDGCVRCGFANSDLLDGINNQPNTNNPSEVFYLDNNLPEGSSTTGANGLGGGFLRLEQAVNIEGIAPGDTDLDWDTLGSNAITGNLNYTVQQFYGDGGVGTGNPFVRGDVKFVRMQGQLTVQSQITIGKSGSLAWNADDVIVKLVHPEVGVVGIYTPENQSSNSASYETIRYHFNGNVQRGAFKVVIENRTGVGNVTVYRHQPGTPALTYLVVQNW